MPVTSRIKVVHRRSRSSQRDKRCSHSRSMFASCCARVSRAQPANGGVHEGFAILVAVLKLAPSPIAECGGAQQTSHEF